MPETCQRSVHPHKNILSTVIGIFVIAEHAIADIEDPILVSYDQLIEGFLPAFLKGFDMFEIGCGFLYIHLDSCFRPGFPAARV